MQGGDGVVVPGCVFGSEPGVRLKFQEGSELATWADLVGELSLTYRCTVSRSITAAHVGQRRTSGSGENLNENPSGVIGYRGRPAAPDLRVRRESQLSLSAVPVKVEAAAPDLRVRRESQPHPSRRSMRDLRRSAGPPGPARISTWPGRRARSPTCRSAGPPGPARISTTSGSALRTAADRQRRTCGSGENLNEPADLVRAARAAGSAGSPGPARISTVSQIAMASSVSRQRRAFGSGESLNRPECRVGNRVFEAARDLRAQREFSVFMVMGAQHHRGWRFLG